MGRVSQVCTLKIIFFRCGFKNVGLKPQKSQKLVILVCICPKWVYPLKQFLQNLARILGPHGHAKFHQCGFKMWPYGRQNRQK